MLNPMAASTPSNPSIFCCQTLENFLGHVNLVTASMDRENNHEQNGSDEEREIPVALPSTDVQKRPRSSPTCLTPRQCQKRVPLREVQVDFNVKFNTFRAKAVIIPVYK